MAMCAVVLFPACQIVSKRDRESERDATRQEKIEEMWKTEERQKEERHRR